MLSSKWPCPLEAKKVKCSFSFDNGNSKEVHFRFDRTTLNDKLVQLDKFILFGLDCWKTRSGNGSIGIVTTF